MVNTIIQASIIDFLFFLRQVEVISLEDNNQVKKIKMNI